MLVTETGKQGELKKRRYGSEDGEGSTSLAWWINSTGNRRKQALIMTEENFSLGEQRGRVPDLDK